MVGLDKSSTSITYTPKKGFSGTDEFSYVVSDGKGGTAVATVKLFVGVDIDSGGTDSGDSGDSAGDHGIIGSTKNPLNGNESYGRISGKSKLNGPGGVGVEGHFELFDEFGNWVDIWTLNQNGPYFNLSTGEYEIDVNPGNYKVQIWPHEPTYESQFYYDSTELDSASIVTVIAGQETEDINFNFKAADTGIISGSVTDSNGEPLNGAELQAFKVDASGSTINNWPDFHINLDGGSSKNGKYNIKLPVGNYKLRVKIWGEKKLMMLFITIK